MQARARGHREQAQRLTLSFRALAALAQVEEPDVAGGCDGRLRRSGVASRTSPIRSRLHYFRSCKWLRNKKWALRKCQKATVVKPLAISSNNLLMIIGC